MKSESEFTFPEGFVWGAAAASYQIEGAHDTDGKGPSVWDMFCERPGNVYEGHHGQVACEHYHRSEGDVQLLKDLGVHAYRLSVSWPRVLPEGRGAVNAKGLAFYDRLIDQLLGAGITPWVTLFHWDFPLALFQRGGWLNRDSAHWFADYARVVTEKLSDRVQQFLTINEPQVFIGLGHQRGEHAPGLRLPLSQVLLAGHHALLAHGLAVQAMRAVAKQPLEIGVAPVGMPKYPETEKPEDVELARRATFDIVAPDVWNNAWWMDPLYKGEYPEVGLKFYGKDAPKVLPGDMETICQKLDYFGVNIYQGLTVRKNTNYPGGFEILGEKPGAAMTAFDWPLSPEALYYGPRFFYERYQLPIVITENGLSCRDWVSLDGHVHDPMRIDYTTRYLRAFRRAIAEGAKAKGYFHWSILDNFEWAEGYRQRFGLVHVDYETQVRTPKDSYHWYRRLIASKGGLLAEHS